MYVYTCLLASRKWIELVGSPNLLLTHLGLPPEGADGSGALSRLYLWPRCPLPAVPLGCVVLMFAFVLQPLTPVRKGLWPGPAQVSGQC